MEIISEAENFAKLQRTNATLDSIKNSYFADAKQITKELMIAGKHPEGMNILDIGCGIAGWQVFLPKGVSHYLIDKSTIDKDLHYGFQKTGSFYNSLEIAKKNLIANGVNEKNIFMQEAKDNKILFNEEFDVIVSLISCGFHYPVETYLDQIYSKLKAGGIFVVDLRKNSNGESVCENKFGNKKIIMEKTKYRRCVFCK